MTRILKFWVVLWVKVTERLYLLFTLIQRILRRCWRIRILIRYHSLMNFIEVFHEIMRRTCLQYWLIKKHELSFYIRYALQRYFLCEIDRICSLIYLKLPSCLSYYIDRWKDIAWSFAHWLLILRYQRIIALCMLLDLFPRPHWGILFHD